MNFFKILGPKKSKIKVLTDLVPDEDLFLVMVHSTYVLT
jgi:hypothetical protein